jgi:hypothetical protein
MIGWRGREGGGSIKPYEFWTSDTGGFVTVFTNKDDCEVELKNDILEYIRWGDCGFSY